MEEMEKEIIYLRNQIRLRQQLKLRTQRLRQKHRQRLIMNLVHLSRTS